ncbi:hypothetical protein [Methylobacterium ajmalii]|jgi:hypothetical protein|uniref:hypothetical protein n=1 Tax=Methylobacterium ajmalii TaxID=2738439 RepID=UPI00190A5B55|nr:hypothetical protein [Methylobacterium ajmalii]MBK3400055.1 hypothetical protein [Methylobacterium ajmalii]MBK3411350.1 hypothetical protein [Methylobacterium ajmalii]MBK3426714.1 hypothetical protein [Methylobacterium ajmalii]
MVSLTLALLTVLPHRRAFVASIAAFVAPIAKSASAAARPLPTVEAAPILALPAPPTAVLTLPAPCRPSPLLTAIEDHRSANLAVNQAVRDYVQAEADSAPDERLLLAIADRAGDQEVAALNALLALTPANAEEVRTLAAYLAEVSTDFDKGAFGAWLFQRFAVMITRAQIQA